MTIIIAMATLTAIKTMATEHRRLFMHSRRPLESVRSCRSNFNGEWK